MSNFQPKEIVRPDCFGQNQREEVGTEQWFKLNCTNCGVYPECHNFEPILNGLFKRLKKPFQRPPQRS